MAQALEKLLGDYISGGLAIVKYGHSAACKRIKIREAAHPVPDENGLQATSKILEICKNAGKKDLVFCLISGGGSALLEKLPEEISLGDLQAASQRLLECGAAIEEINTIRKHISLVKGGKLARAVVPAKCLTLIISDVIGDPLEAIASGPTAPDATTFSDARAVIQKYRLKKQLPASVRGYLEKGLRGEAPETLKPGDPVFRLVENIILGSNFTALTAARKTAEALGFNTTILGSSIRGEAREAARAIAGIVQEVSATGNPVSRPACLLFGGETTVTVRGKGKGGRNQEFALAALLVLKDMPQPHILFSCGSDGTDGPTDAAGAFISPEIYRAVTAANLDPLFYLQNNDAYHFFEQAGGLIKTGPTGTNVMDIGIVLIP
jgi:glycerate-2-kinase